MSGYGTSAPDGLIEEAEVTEEQRHKAQQPFKVISLTSAAKCQQIQCVLCVSYCCSRYNEMTSNSCSLLSPEMLTVSFWCACCLAGSAVGVCSTKTEWLQHCRAC